VWVPAGRTNQVFTLGQGTAGRWTLCLSDGAPIPLEALRRCVTSTYVHT
jgi:hypothetical protein